MINIFITVRCCLYDLINFNNHEAAILCDLQFSSFEFCVLRITAVIYFLLSENAAIYHMQNSCS